MTQKSVKQNANRNVSLEDEQRLRDKTFELYREMEQLGSKPVRTEQEEREYILVKAQYYALYEEYAGKYSIVMEKDKQEKPADEHPKSSKLFRTMAVCLGVMILLVTFVVVGATMNSTDGKRLADTPKTYVQWDGPETVMGDGYKITVEDAEDTDSNVLNVDNRVPDLKSAENSDQLPERRHFSWKARDGATVLTWTPQVYKETYEAYRGAERYLDSDDFERYISDANNERLILEIAHTLESIGEGMGYSDWEVVNEAMNFVQSIEYVSDEDSTGHEEWPKYVTELVYDECGDCEDKAIFLAGILKALDYDVVLIAFDGHLGVGIASVDDIGGANYEVKGKKYYYIEPSYPGWEIGQIPSEVDAEQVAIVPI